MPYLDIMVVVSVVLGVIVIGFGLFRIRSKLVSLDYSADKEQLTAEIGNLVKFSTHNPGIGLLLVGVLVLLIPVVYVLAIGKPNLLTIKGAVAPPPLPSTVTITVKRELGHATTNGRFETPVPQTPSGLQIVFDSTDYETTQLIEGDKIKDNEYKFPGIIKLEPKRAVTTIDVPK
jgi:hypothetical protein